MNLLPKSKLRHSTSAGQRRVAGVELSPHVLRMVLLEPQGRDRYRVVNLHSEPVVPFCRVDSPLMTQAVRDGLTKLAGNPRGLDVWAGLTSDRVHVHHLKLPHLKPSHLSQGAYWATQREEAFSTASTVFDFEVEREVEINGKKEMAVSAFLLPSEDRDSLTRLFARAGYPLQGITLPLYAMRNFFRSGWLPASRDARIFSHIGAHSSRIGIWADEQSVLTRGIPIGLEQVANELVSVLRPIPDRASALRMILNLGHDRWEDYAHDPEQVFSAIQPTLERMARQIDRTLEYYQTQFRDRDPVQKVHLSGSITESPRCTEYLRGEITVPLEVLDPFLPEVEAPGVSIPEDPAERHAYATAFGFALSKDSFSPNFLHTFKDRQRDILHRRINNRIFALFFILAIALGGYYAHQQSNITQLRAEQNRVENRVQAARPLLDASQVLSQVSNLHGEFATLSRTIDHYQAVSILAELGALTPDEFALQSVSAFLGKRSSAEQSQSPWLRVTGILSGENDLLETELSLYIRRLEASPLFSSAKLQSSRPLPSDEDNGRLHFNLELSLAAVETETVEET